MTDVEIPTEAPGGHKFVDYWTGVPDPERFYMPDGIQYIEFVAMRHGQRSKYMAKINRDITIEKASGNARMKTDLIGDANALIDEACVGWYMLRSGEEVPFSHGTPGSTLNQWLQQADPAIVDRLELAIRKANPWLGGQASSKEIREQIESLEKDYTEAVEREQGE